MNMAHPVKQHNKLLIFDMYKSYIYGCEFKTFAFLKRDD